MYLNINQKNYKVNILQSSYKFHCGNSPYNDRITAKTNCGKSRNRACMVCYGKKMSNKTVEQNAADYALYIFTTQDSSVYIYTYIVKDLLIFILNFHSTMNNIVKFFFYIKKGRGFKNRSTNQHFLKSRL